MSNIFRIAIDGPGGAGKSTIAKLVAKELGISRNTLNKRLQEMQYEE